MSAQDHTYMNRESKILMISFSSTTKSKNVSTYENLNFVTLCTVYNFSYFFFTGVLYFLVYLYYHSVNIFSSRLRSKAIEIKI